MERRLLVLPREISRTCVCGKKKVKSRDNSCREKSAEAIVPKKKGREGLNLNQVKVNECYPVKGRMQKISYDNSQGKDRSETESTLGVQTYIGITENNFTTIEQPDYGLLEMILSPTNLNKAYKQVKSNKGCGGVDGFGEIL